MSTETQLLNTHLEAMVVKSVDLLISLSPLSLATSYSPIEVSGWIIQAWQGKLTAVLFMVLLELAGVEEEGLLGAVSC